jgi:hypothetical protein
MTRPTESGFRRGGFALVLLVVAAVSITTVTLSSQTGASLYDNRGVRQSMRSCQADWLARGYHEALLGMYVTRNTVPSFTAGAGVVYAPSSAQFASTSANESIGVKVFNRLSTTFGPNAGRLDIEVRMYNSPRGTGPPVVEREINLRGARFEAGFRGGGLDHDSTNSRRVTGWQDKDGNVL